MVFMSLRFGPYVSEKLTGTISNIATSDGSLQDRIAAGRREFMGLNETDFIEQKDITEFRSLLELLSRSSALNEQDARNVVDRLLSLRKTVCGALAESACLEDLIDSLTETNTKGHAGARSKALLESLSNARIILRDSHNFSKISDVLHKVSTDSGGAWDPRHLGGLALKLSGDVKKWASEPDSKSRREEVDRRIQILMIAACFVD